MGRYTVHPSIIFLIHLFFLSHTFTLHLPPKSSCFRLSLFIFLFLSPFFLSFCLFLCFSGIHHLCNFYGFHPVLDEFQTKEVPLNEQVHSIPFKQGMGFGSTLQLFFVIMGSIYNFTVFRWGEEMGVRQWLMGFKPILHQLIQLVFLLEMGS
jgi:hypothetical protein